MAENKSAKTKLNKSKELENTLLTLSTICLFHILFFRKNTNDITNLTQMSSLIVNHSAVLADLSGLTG